MTIKKKDHKKDKAISGYNTHAYTKKAYGCYILFHKKWVFELVQRPFKHDLLFNLLLGKLLVTRMLQKICHVHSVALHTPDSCCTPLRDSGAHLDAKF